MSALTDALAEQAANALNSAGVVVTAESNVSPRVTLYDARDSAPSLLDVLGIKVHVVARTSKGNVIAEYGEPVQFSPLLAIVYGAVLVLGITAIGTSVARLLR